MNERPTVGIGVLVFKEGRILLGERIGGKANGFYAAPGGSLEYGESPITAALREVKEETGLEVTNVSFVCAGYTKEFPSKINLCFSANWVSGEAKTIESEKCKGWEWFSLEELPQPLVSINQLAISTHLNKSDYYEA